MEFVKLDGSHGEGGGQIIRTALALSTLTGKPFEIINIRKNRPKPGLKAQHLFAVKALKELCHAVVIGDELGSERLVYEPHELEYNNLNVDIGTAGSITLLLQALLPVIMFSNKKIHVKITGGTDVSHAMPIDYFLYVLLPHLRKYAGIETELLMRGYYPKGGGKFNIKINPKFSFSDTLKSEENKIELEKQGKLLLIKGISHASKELMKANVAERQARAARFNLTRFNVPVKIDTSYRETLSIGSGITLWAVFSEKEETDFNNPIILGADSLGEKTKKSEKVGEEAAEMLIKEIESDAAVDCHLSDQLLPFMAFFGGKIKTSEITEHAKTNIDVIENFLDVKFEIEEKIISC